MANVTLLLGSNLGDRTELIAKAIEGIEQRVGKIVGSSTLKETEPWGYSSMNSYLNVALEVSTNFSAFEVLDITQRLEWDLGRRRNSDAEGYEDRPIDIDLLYYRQDGNWATSGERIDSRELTLPHPRIEEREFVLDLLRELREDLGVMNC